VAGTDVAAAANARVVSTVEYTVQQRGWRSWFALASLQQRALAGRNSAPVMARHDGNFHGYAASPQRMTGLAPLALSGRVVAKASSELVDERSAGLDDPALRIFRERMRRGLR
jgi:hypothetical protein